MILEKKIENSCYTISTDGIVKSNRDGVEKTMCFIIDHKGYKRLRLIIGTERKSLRIHRLVAIAFIPNPENKPQVNHINGIKTDNRVENLEWCTGSENSKHSFVIGLQCNKGKNHPCCKLREEDVLNIRKSKLKLTELGLIYNISKSQIWSIKNHKTWKHIN